MPALMSNENITHISIRQWFYPQVPCNDVNRLRTKCDMVMKFREASTGTLSLQRDIQCRERLYQIFITRE